MDDLADLAIHGYVDDIVERLIEKLDLTIPQFKLDRWAKIKLKQDKNGQETLYVSGMDKLGGPFELFKKIYINNKFGGEYVMKKDEKKDNYVFEVALFAQGHYREEKLILKVPRKLLLENENILRVNMICNPYRSGKWELVEAYGEDPKQSIGKLDFISCSENSKASFASASTSASSSSSVRSGSQVSISKQIQPKASTQPRGKSTIRKPVIMVPPKAPKTSAIQKAGAQIIVNVKKG